MFKNQIVVLVRQEIRDSPLGKITSNRFLILPRIYCPSKILPIRQATGNHLCSNSSAAALMMANRRCQGPLTFR